MALVALTGDLSNNKSYVFYENLECRDVPSSFCFLAHLMVKYYV